MTTKEHVHRLVDQLGDEQLKDLERELSLRLGPGPGPDNQPDDEADGSLGERPYDPLGKLIGMVGDEYDGPTDVSTHKYKYVADAIEGNWARD